MWLAPRARGQDEEILRCDLLPEWARWSYLTPSRLPAASREKNSPKSHIVNPLWTKLVRSRGLNIGLLRFCEIMGPDGIEVHSKTSHLVSSYVML